MTLRQLCGFILGGVGTWLMWQAGTGLAQYVNASHGSVSFSQALFEPATALRILTAMAAFIGGLAALVEVKGGAWLAGISSFIFGILTFAMIANRADVSLWRDEAIFLIILTGLFLTLVVSRREEGETNAYEFEETE
jgi:hypothetical protein